MARAIFYAHQTIGAGAGVCACDSMHQMEKTEMAVETNVNRLKYIVHQSVQLIQGAICSSKSYCDKPFIILYRPSH